MADVALSSVHIKMRVLGVQCQYPGKNDNLDDVQQKLIEIKQELAVQCPVGLWLKV